MKPEDWDDNELTSGMPYILLWQQFAEGQQYFNGLWTPPAVGTDLETDWLANIPLCNITSSNKTIYHYKAFDGNKCELIQFQSTSYLWFFSIKWTQPSGWEHCNKQGGKYVTVTELETCRWGINPCGDCYLGSGDLVKKRYLRCDPTRYKAVKCTSDIQLDEIWTDAEIPGDLRNGTTYQTVLNDAHELEDKYDIFVHNDLDVGGKTYSIFGETSGPVVYTWNASGLNWVPIEDKAYIYPEEYKETQEENNYQLYLKPWITIHARILETKGEYFDETKQDPNVCGSYFSVITFRTEHPVTFL